MIRSMNPYRTAAFNRSVIIVPLETDKERHQRENAALLRGFAERDRLEAIAGARGIINGLVFAICLWIAMFLWCCL